MAIITVALILISIPFSWNAQAADGHFEPPYSDHGRDDDGDGYYDFLVFNATVNITEAGTFNIYGGLYNSTSNLITEDTMQQALPVGVHVLQLEFDGIDIYNCKEDGPYATYLYLYDHMWQNLSWDYALTSNYSYTDFQHNPAEFNPPHHDYGLDTNANSLHDFLVAEVNITANANGTYRIEGDLYDSTGSTWIWSASNESHFDKGNHTVELRLLGCKIRNKEIDGPYKLELQLKKGSTQILDEDIHTTQSYAYTDFEGFAAYFTGPSSDEGIDLNGNSLYEYLRLTVGVRVNYSGSYEIEGDLSDDSVIPIYITSTTNNTYMSQGNTTVDLYFPGFEIYESGITSKYIAELELRDEDNVILSRWMHTTPRYNYDDFEPYPPANLDPPHSDYGLDTDSDSLYNYLVVNISVDVDATLGYRFNSSLYDSTHSVFITGTQNITNLSAGARTVPLYFNGWDIYNSTINGSYNVTIRVYDQYDHFLGRGYHNTTNYTYDEFEHEVSDATPPEIRSVLASPNPQEVDGNVNITANITDDQGVVGGWVIVTDPDGLTVGNYSLSYDSGTEKYYHNQSYSKLGTYSFTIWAMDIGNNWNSSSGSFTMQDTMPPTISNATASPDPQEVFESVNITATVNDDTNLTLVKVNISDPDGLLLGNYTMSYDSGSGKHYHEDPYTKLGNHTFTIWAKDSSDNWNSSTGSFTIHDTTPPSISNATALPNPQEIHGDVNITATISDNYNLTLAKVEVLDPDGASVGNFTMLYDSGSGKYCYEQSYSILGNYSFTIWAKDSSGNWNSSSGTFKIVDMGPPSISNVTANPNPQEVFEKVNLTAEVRDNENVSVVVVLVVDPDGSTVGNFSMEMDSGSGKYYFENSYSKLGNYTFTIWAKDGAGNWNSSSGSFTIHDTTKPMITNVNANPNPQEVYEDVNISATVADNFNLSEVKVVVMDPDGQLVGNFSMSPDSGSGKHYHQASYSKLGDYSFTIWAKDSSGNWNYSTGGFTMRDTTLPTISNLEASPNPQEVFGNVNLTAFVSDNFNLTIVKVVVLDPDGGLVGNYTMGYESGSGKYYYEQSYSKLGDYTYTIWAGDSSGNWNSSSSTFTMRDTIPPGISNVNATPNPQEVHGNVNITANVSDNYDLNLIKVVIDDPDGIQVGNFTMGYDSGSGKYYHEQSYSKVGDYSFTIWANDSSGNWNYSSSSFTIQDTTPPTISDVDASPDPQEVFGDVNITAKVSDNFNLSVVKVEITDPDGIQVGNFTMGYDSATGKYYYERSFSKLGTYAFTIWANDTSDNWNSTSGNFVIQDTTPPSISNVNASPNPQEVFGNVNITATVSDNYNLTVVQVVILDPDGALIGNISMKYDLGSGKYYHEDSYSELGIYSFTIWAKDSSGNWNSSPGSFTIQDTTPPSISDASANPNPQEVFGDVNITAAVGDNFNLTLVKVVVTDPDGGLVGNFTMEYDTIAAKYYYERSYSKLGTYSFTIWAKDSSDNWNSSSSSFAIQDTIPPTITNVNASPDPQEVHGQVNITANISDNHEISLVKLVVNDPDGGLVGNFTMLYDSGSGKYYYEQSYSKLGTYSITIWASDSSGNWNSSSGSFTMQDTTPPIITNVNATPDPQEVHGSVNITATVSDNFNVSEVKVVVWDPDGLEIGNFSMQFDSGKGEYYYESTYSKLGNYSFTVWAKDTSGNWGSSSGSFTIQDTTPPTFSNVSASPNPQEVFGFVNITVDVDDNVNVSEVSVSITDPDGIDVGNFSMVYDTGSGKYYYESSYSKLGSYSFTIWARDTSGNWNSTSGSFVMHDTTPPTISDVSASPSPQEVFGSVNITATVGDNFNLSYAKVTISDPDGLLVGNFSMLYDSVSGKYFYEDTYSKLGDYSFTIWATDSSGNWNSSSGDFTMHDTTPPEISNAGASPDPQEVFGDVNITATVMDNFELSGVNVIVTDPDGLQVGNFSMVFDSGSNKYCFETSYSKLGTYSFTVWAKDTSSNWNSSSGSFEIHDTIRPNISDVAATPNPQEVFGDVNITASVSDNYNLTVVKVEILDPHGVLVGNMTMEYDTGSGYFYYESSYPEIGTYTHTIWAKDSSNNWNSTSGSFTMFDITFPTIRDVVADPNPQETGGSVNISAVVSDDVGVSGVWIEIYNPLSALIGNFTMDYDSMNGRYYHESSYTLLGTYSFTIIANDTSNKWNSTSRTFIIQDSTLPTISDITAAPDPQEVHGAVNITATVGDNYELSEVRVVITDPDGTIIGNFSMVFDSGSGNYCYESTYSKIGLYNFTVLAKDSSDNWNMYSSTFLMQDTTDPVIGTITTSPDPQEVHGDVNISVDITDNYLIEEVKAVMTDPDGQPVGNISMVLDVNSGEFFYESSYSKIGTYTFTVWVKDSSGNWNSKSSSFTIQDTTLPEILNVLALPSPLEVPGNVNITAEVSDNYQLSVVTVEVTGPDSFVIGNFSMVFDPVSGRHFYERTYLMPGNHSLTVWAGDVSGNWNYVSSYFIMMDTTNPVISNVDPSPNPQEVYWNVNITAVITDNHKILEATVIISDPDGLFMGNFSMSFDAVNGVYYYELAYPKIGNYKITVFAIDESGNWITRLSSFDMMDATLPEISSVSATPDPQEVLGDVTTSARVDDNYQLNEIKIVMVDPDSTVLGNFSMSYDAGNDLYYHVTTCLKTGTYTFTIWAADSSGNWNSSSGSFVVQDTASPMISNVLPIPDPQEVHGSVDITAEVTDNYELSEVRVVIFDPDSVLIGNFSMLYDSPSSLYHYESTYSMVGIHTFTVWAMDTGGNWNQLDSSFTIQDTTPPIVSNVVADPDPQEVFGWVDISAEVTDNYQLFSVYVEIFDPADLLVGNFSMTFDSVSGRYLFGLACDIVGTYDFLIRASDSNDNWQLHPGQFTIADNTPPVVTNATTNPPQQLPFGEVNISTSAYDNYLLSDVFVDIIDPDSNPIGNFTMHYDSLNDRYFWEDIYGVIGGHHFCIWARDSSDNWGSFCGQFTIADDIPPDISNVVADPDPQEVFGTVSISAVVTDNYLVEQVNLLIKDPTGLTIGNFSMQFDAGSGARFHEISCSLLGMYSFEIWVKDGGSNWASFAGSFDIRDTTPPEADAGVDQEIMHGETVLFDGSASTDNYAVETYEWTFNDGIEDVILLGIDPQHTFQEPGLYTVTLKVTDTSGNSNQDTVYVNVIGEKVPNAPEGLTVQEIGDDFVLLVWTAPTTNTDGSELTDLKGYYIYRSAQSGGPYIKIGTLIILSESYMDRNLYSGFVGYYVVTAYNFEGVESGHSNEATGIIPEKGSVSGKIVDENGIPVYGAQIGLSKDGFPMAVAQSDEKGNFTIDEIDDGVYEIVISKTGFVTFSEDIVIMDGAQVVLDEVAIESLPETKTEDMPFFEVILIVTIAIVLVLIVLFVFKRRSKKEESE